ncbi:MAG: Fic family protein [Planctomycetes bacterium]|jgi:hypothetical protein|nr:Fic family protein [Planctomycetota bacterium]
MTERQKGHHWHPIEDLPAPLRTYREPEVDDLVRVLVAKRADLAGASSLAAYVARIVRSWSIETGILEDLYTLSSGVTMTLVEQGFDSALISHGDSNLPAGQLIRILDAHRDAAEGLFAFVRGGRTLSTSYIKELHAAMTRHQAHSDAIDSLGNWIQVPLRRGDWKTQPNNPADRVTRAIRHEYCPPEQVASEMDRLVAMHHDHHSVHYLCEAAWLHHRFTQVHPFQDGNGRVARALASLVSIRAGGLPIVVMRDQKQDYIRALEAADQNDLRPLIQLFARQQRDALLRGVEQAQTTLENPTLDAVLAGIRTRLTASSQADPGLCQRIDELVDVATAVLREIADAAERALKPMLKATVTEVPRSVTQVHASPREPHRRALLLSLVGDSSLLLTLRMRVIGSGPQGVGIAELVITGQTADLATSDAISTDGEFSFTAERQREEVLPSFREWLLAKVTYQLDRWRRHL